jgi:hypothetical protein
LQTCSLCNSLSPDMASHCISCNSDLSQNSTTSIARKKFQENTKVLYIRIMVSDDCCPACRESEGAYSKTEIPSLPIEGCSNPIGCRCFYQPFLDEL